MSLNETPRANRIHIGIFGKRNSGKSSLINALTGQDIALVSAHAGTTTDPVYKAMELHPVGPVVFIDTAGFDDQGDLGALRVERTKEVIGKTDVALLVFDEGPLDELKVWMNLLEEAKVPIIPVVNKADQLDRELLCEKVRMVFALSPYLISAKTGEGIEYLKTAIAEVTKDLDVERYILANLIEPGDTVLLVMPQDIQAPRGRLILPQVQTIRELLDRSCTTVCTTADNFAMALSALAAPPNLIVTDSQCFGEVYKGKPAASKLTSFSVLFAAYKGDMKEFEKGAYVIDRLSNDGKVLIAEACTHAPLTEDIGREKIPALLKKRYPNITVDIVSGAKFPKNLGDYDLIIHCGACMFNRKLVLSRIKAAKDAGVAITNYGIVMAYFAEILDKIDIPE